MGLYDKCPCRGCEAPKRHPGCHGTCEDKAEWDRDFSEAKKAVRQERERDHIVSGFVLGNSSRVQKFLHRVRRK